MATAFRSMTDSDIMEVPTYEALVNRYPGVKAINEECNRIYPDQLNPLQIQSLIKCWRGGPDPLDYISIFNSDGNSDDAPQHWHYVSYGLSDLHCDGRLFVPQMFGPDKSGFGIELSFRLKKQSDEPDPPLWPAKIMQSLARYVYNYGQPFLPGDHISWHQSLNIDDPNANKELCQILLTSDPQLQAISGPAGNCEFVQIVPVTTEELLTVQKWSVNAFLNLMRDLPECGGKYLVTDIHRTKSVFEIKPSLEQELIQGILHDGSDLSGVNASVCNWTPEGWKYYDKTNCHYLKDEYHRLYCHQRRTGHQDLPFSPQPQVPEEDEDQCESESEDDLEYNSRTPRDEDVDGDLASTFNSKCRVDSAGKALPKPTMTKCHEPFPSSIFAPSVTYYDLIHITINLEAGFCFPLALTGRLRHGRHFTFKGITASTAITLVSPSVQGSFVTEGKPFGAYAGWLQIFMSDQLVETMVTDFDQLLATPNVAYPKTFVWPQWNFGLTLVL